MAWVPLRVAPLVAFVLACAAPVRAQQTEDSKVLAESLFREGRRLMDAGRAAEGCRKLEDSQRLDPTAGTLLALATCHELEGRIATAWGEFTQSVATARRENRADREAFAREHIAVLEPLLPRVVIDVPKEARIEGLTLSRNGAELSAAAWGIALPCDPGEVKILARAKDRKTWTFQGSVAKRDLLRVVVPALEEEPRPVEPAASPAGTRATEAYDAETAKAAETRKLIAYVVAGASVVALGVGTAFGVRAIDKQNSSDRECPKGPNGQLQCSQAGADDNAQARQSATVANVTIIGGLVGLGAAAALYLTAPRTAAPKDAGRGPRAAPPFAFSPTLGPHVLGGAVSGQF